MRLFNLLWAGQAASLIGSSVTAFAVGIWVFVETGSPTYFTLLVLAASLPGIVLLPLAGTLVDRLDRRRVMLLSDAGTALVPVAAFILLSTDTFAFWQLYLLAAFGSVCKSLQWPAFAALVAEIVPRDKLSKANGKIGLAEAAGEVLGALIAGGLYAALGLSGLLLIDIATFALALSATLLSLRWLPPAAGRAHKGERAPLREEMTAGWMFIRHRPGLLGLLLFFSANNLGMQMVIVLVPPLVMSISGPAAYGIVQAIGWAGMVLGGALISFTREPQHRVRAILTVAGCQALFVLAMGAGHAVWVVAAGMFAILAGYSVTNAVTATLWQIKTPHEVQGRVFAVRRMIAWSANPFAYALAGLFAQFVATPLVTGDGALAGSIGLLTGPGLNGGIALVFLAVGPLLLGVVAAAALHPRVRLLERELPDAPALVALPDPSLVA